MREMQTQDGRLTIVFGPYEWIVLEENDEGFLIITKEIINQMDFHNHKGPISWEHSFLRNYLNSEFLEIFSPVEQNLILWTQTINSGNPWYQVSGTSFCPDKVFLLSVEEVLRYLTPKSLDLLMKKRVNQRYWFDFKDPLNTLRSSRYMGYVWWWWTRTPGKNLKTAAYIHGDGNIGMQGNGVGPRIVKGHHPITMSTCGGVRPALWLKKES